jgi:primosomal protein N' (replication factor Y)
MSEFATVILTIPNEDGFTYRTPADLRNAVKPGVQVIVPFGKRYVSGIVLTTSDKLPDHLGDTPLKDIRDIVSVTPVINGDLMDLLKWVADYYICHLGEAYRLIHSQLNVGKSRQMVRRLHPEIPETLSIADRNLLTAIPYDREVPLRGILQKQKGHGVTSRLVRLEKDGYIVKNYSQPAKKARYLTEDFYRRISGSEAQDKYAEIKNGRRTKSVLLLEHLENKDWTPIADLKDQGFSRPLLEKLVKNQLLEKKTEITGRKIHLAYHEEIENVTPSAEQQQIIQQISDSLARSRFEVFLLHGITGSGKTQIYIESIKKVLESGKQVIVLIPEIVLTPQTLVRFRHYFGDQVGVIHSRLTAAEKREILSRIREGEYKVVIGPRSAIFAPVKQLGLVVVDEEHEGSYKQHDAQPHYHARDVAIYRASLNKAVVLLGSATPSFESLQNVREGRYKYFHLGKRISQRSLPHIALVDLREEWKKGGDYPVISENLELQVESRMLTREQVMILQNRRGYSPYIICHDCGFVAKCPHCEITLTYHQFNHSLICHYCGYREKAPDTCPSCHGMDIIYKGIGTQRLEEVLQEKFSGFRILRMDQDTTRGRHGHMEILEKFRSGQADILLGTKMIAKGLDFEKVTLVGIISADQGLHFPDFRASEKVFQLLTQAAGRAGRGSSSGEVVVQTFDPSHFIFKHLMTHNYQSFFERELTSRKHLKYPPFSRLILVRIEGKELPLVQKYAEAITDFLWKANKKKSYSVLGPAPSPLAKIQNIYRYQILIKQDKEKDASSLYARHILKEGLFMKNEVKNWPVKVIIDVDPIEIL